MKAMMRVATGQLVDVTNLRPEDIRVWDIAWALHHTNRYLGHTPVPWNVLSHTGLCFQLGMMESKGTLNTFDRIGILIHDAAEAYIGDMPRPLKQIPESHFFCELEERIMDVILKRLGIPREAINWDLVKRYDNRALHIEMITLTPDLRGNSYLPPEIYAGPVPPLCVAKPIEYVGLLRDLCITLSGTNDGKPDQINELFFLPDHLALYANPPEARKAMASSGKVETGSLGPLDDQVLNMQL